MPLRIYLPLILAAGLAAVASGCGAAPGAGEPTPALRPARLEGQAVGRQAGKVEESRRAAGANAASVGSGPPGRDAPEADTVRGGEAPATEAAPQTGEAAPETGAPPRGGAPPEAPRIEAEEQPPVPRSEHLAGSELLSAEVATVGWDGFTNAPIVLLRELGSGRVVPIWVGLAEARAIAAALHGISFPRPMTHDLMTNLLSRLHAQLEEVMVHDLRNGTYYGLLKLKVEGRAEPLLVDTRPSDGLALALRTGAAIRLAKSILDQTPDYDFLAPEAGEQVVQSLGLTVVSPTDELRREFGLPERPGLVVTVAAGQAAEKGLQRGDLIVEVNGVVPEAPMDFLNAIRDAPFTEAIRLKYWRAGEERAVELTPKLPAAPERKTKEVA